MALPAGESRLTVERTCQARPSSRLRSIAATRLEILLVVTCLTGSGFLFASKKTCCSGTPSGRTPLKVQPGASIAHAMGLELEGPFPFADIRQQSLDTHAVHAFRIETTQR